MFKKIFLATAMIAVVSLAVFAVFSCANNAYAMSEPGSSTGVEQTGRIVHTVEDGKFVSYPETRPVYTQSDRNRDTGVAILVLGVAAAKAATESSSSK
ncbi:MAG: hypothetical protein LBQ50_06640 [Planctomycetaceae bacterium]|jgi:hypothetical protein|nr:hypothetical protein [Planctomycetaceae bacterium]